MYEVVGKDLVNHVLAGYNVCVLAYGQTGSGKTYSMMGNATETGLIGHMCEAILGAPAESHWRREFEVSYMEGVQVDFPFGFLDVLHAPLTRRPV